MSRVLTVMMVVVLGCVGCTLSPPIKMKVQATATLNCDEHEASLPVMLRIYQLSDIDKFERSSFSDLWKKERETLGDSLLAAKEITLLPKSSVELTLPQEEKAKYLALVATFRNSDGNCWRVFEPMNYVMRFLITKVIKVRLTGYTIELL